MSVEGTPCQSAAFVPFNVLLRESQERFEEPPSSSIKSQKASRRVLAKCGRTCRRVHGSFPTIANKQMGAQPCLASYRTPVSPIIKSVRLSTCVWSSTRLLLCVALLIVVEIDSIAFPDDDSKRNDSSWQMDGICCERIACARYGLGPRHPHSHAHKRSSFHTFYLFFENARNQPHPQRHPSPRAPIGSSSLQSSASCFPLLPLSSSARKDDARKSLSRPRRFLSLSQCVLGQADHTHTHTSTAPQAHPTTWHVRTEWKCSPIHFTHG